MPFVEISTSQQNPSRDTDGYAHITRTFKLWQVDPKVLFGDITTVTHATQPNVYMPGYGDTIATISGGSGDALLYSTKVVLYNYQFQQTSATTFIAVAMYSNDPKLAPLGIGYRSSQQLSLVPIAYYRNIPVISNGVGTQQVRFTLEDRTVNVPMQVARITQNVVIPRVARKDAVNASAKALGELHLIDNTLMRYEGVDLQMRGTQWFDATYTWYFEAGVTMDDFEASLKTVNEGGSPTIPEAIYSPGVVESWFSLGSTRWMLPPYTSIEPQFTVDLQVSPIKVAPIWVYRRPAPVFLTGWKNLYGSNRFEWELIP